jgi:hypothetical protein
MGMRVGIGACAVWTAALAIAPTAAAGPSKDHTTQRPIRCEINRGCNQMRNTAVGYARSFCQAEGGVLRGELRSDYSCEQRGINCVLRGRIECRGRIDPRQVPGQGGPPPEPGAPPLPGASRPSVCLDADCDSYVDYAPGHREQGVHACRAGFAMTGVGGATGDIVCGRQVARFMESTIDLDTARNGLHACPPEQLMIGLSDDRSRLLCARFSAKVSGEIVQRERLELGLQVCKERDGRRSFLTGIDGAREAISCALVVP